MSLLPEDQFSCSQTLPYAVSRSDSVCACMCVCVCVCECVCVCVCVCGGGGGGDEDWDIIQCPRLLSYEVRGRGGAWGVSRS